MMDVLNLLQDQSAQNRANFAQAQADRAEAAATKPQQWNAQGRDADSGRMALSANGDEARLIGDRLTSGDIQPGQAVRVNGAGGLVTVDQKPFKQRQQAQEQAQSTAQPYWIAFSNGFAISFDTEAQSFTESQQYPEYEEYSAAVQGDRMFPGGKISHFAASDRLWVVGGTLGFNLVSQQPARIRLALAVSSDQGQIWQVCEQFIPTALNGIDVLVSSLVYGEDYFFALVYSYGNQFEGQFGYQVWRSADGLVWEVINNIETPTFGFNLNRALFDDLVEPALAVWEGVVYLLQSVVGYGVIGGEAIGFKRFLKETAIHSYTDSEQGIPSFKLSQRFEFNEQSQYGAYNAYGNPIHAYDINLLRLPFSLYPFLLSSNDLDAIADYGDAVYDPEAKTYLSLLHPGTNQSQAIAYAASIEGQVFLMVAQRWGFRNDDQAIPFGFAAIHEGASWRTCEHPFLNTLPNEGFHDSDVEGVTYSATLQRWLVYETRSYLALSGINGDDWSEPVLPELTTTFERRLDARFGALAAIARQIRAYTVAGNYVSSRS